MLFSLVVHCCHSLSLIAVCCHMLSLVVLPVFTIYHLLHHLFSFVVTRSHTLSLDVQLVVTRHSLSLYVPLTFTLCTTCCHKLSYVVTRCTTRCHSLSLVVTRCTTRLSFYKRSTETVKSSCFKNFRYTGIIVFSYE